MLKNLHMSTKIPSFHQLHVRAALLVTGALALCLGACTSHLGSVAPAPSVAMDYGTTQKLPMSPPAERPGLGTTLGFEYSDDTVTTHFYRRSERTPDALGSFHYNDSEGAKAMAELAGSPTKRSGSFKLAGGKLKVSLESWGDTLSWYESGGRIVVMGDADRSYAIVLENTTKDRLEVVVSVDGLDVLSGKAASASRRGYVVEKHGRISINGMRAGNKMRRFQFGSVKDSHAATSGGATGARNVGVIGVAVYVEDAAAAKLARVREGLTREGAHAFPEG